MDAFMRSRHRSQLSFLPSNDGMGNAFFDDEDMVDLAGLDWTELDWLELDWLGLDWLGLDWLDWLAS